MSSRGWQTRLVPLFGGLHAEDANNAGPPSIIFCQNGEFGVHEGVRGRPGAIRKTGFTSRGLDSSNNPTVTTGGAFGSKVALAVDRVRDGLGERPLLVTTGRAYTYGYLDGAQWTDRLGVMPLSAHRAASTYKPDDLVTPSGHQYALPIASTFGPSDLSGNFWILGDGGTLLEPAHVATTNQDVGGVARCGTVEAYVYIERSTSNLKLIVHSAGASTVTAFTLATDAAGVTGYGDAPCICCDFDQANFFVSYVTTSINNVVKILRVSTAGSVLTTQTVTSGVGNPITTTWLTNTSVATDRLVLGWTDGTNGYHTKVYAASTLVDQALDVLLSGIGSATGIQTQIVVGAAQNGQCYYAIVKLVGGNQVLEIGTRSLTAATSGFMKAWTNYSYTPAGGFAGGNSDQGASLYIQHQPIVFQGRVLFGLSAIRNWRGTVQGGVSGPGFEQQGATWYVYDLTDQHYMTGSGGSLFDPVLCAHGPWEGSQASWQCATAVIWSGNGQYSFQTVDWTQFVSRQQNSNTALGNGSTAVSTYFVDIGFAGWDGLNVIQMIEPQVSHWGETTVIAGSAPRAIAGGDAHPLGFQFLGSPGIRATLAAGGALPTGQYGWTAVWRWVDDRGQTTQSAPAPSLVTSGGGGVPVNSRVTLTSTPPILAERGGKVFVDFYSTGVNPPATGAIYYLQGTVSVDTANAGTTGLTASLLMPTVVSTSGKLLYTTGGILENQPAEASGGAAVLGRRLWVSDGHTLAATKYGVAGDGPAFNHDGPLVVDIPPAAGAVRGLGTVDGRIVAFCARGIFASGGDGPEDVGTGPDFLSATRLSEVACQGGRTVVSSPRGVVFQADAQFSGDVNASGPWLLGRDGNIVCLTARVQTQVAANQTLGGCAWLPEREWYIWPDQDQGTLLVWDIRTDAWSVWVAGAGFTDWPTHVGTAGGQLWGAGGTEPVAFAPNNGQDFDTQGRDIALIINTSSVSMTDDSRLAWAKVRAFKVLGEVGGNHTLTALVLADDTLFALPITSVAYAPGSDTTWPTHRYAPEFRLSVSKASTLAFNLSMSPANGQLNALEIQHRPAGGRAPANFRA